MNIWFAAALPANSYGGVNRTIYELSTLLRRRGHRVLVIQEPHSRSHPLSFAILLGVRLLLELFNRPHWIIARSSDGVFAALIVRMLRLDTRVILHNHGWEEKVHELEQRLPASIITNPTTWKATRIRFPLLRLNLRLCHYCCCGTLDEVRWLKEHYPAQAAKIKYQPNGVFIAAPEPYWESVYEWPLNFLFIGGPTWKKNFEYALTLFMAIREKLPQARLYWVGAGNYDSRLLEHAPADSLSVIPHESFRAIGRWYRKCPYLLSTSRFEGGHSLAILEALSYGCVVFTARLASTAEFVTHKESGIVLEGVTADKDSAVMVDYVTNAALMHTISRNAYVTARHHRWERQLGLLERILSSPR